MYLKIIFVVANTGLSNAKRKSICFVHGNKPQHTTSSSDSALLSTISLYTVSLGVSTSFITVQIRKYETGERAGAMQFI